MKPSWDRLKKENKTNQKPKTNKTQKIAAAQAGSV